MAGDRGASLLRHQAMEVFRAGLAAADPAIAMRGALTIAGGRLAVSGRPLPPRVRTIRAAAFGKAACAMAQAVEEVVPPDLFPGPGIAVTSRGSARALRRFQVIEAGHPLPDADGLRGARAIAAALAGARDDEAVI